ncbi:MAG TPA: lamin tail domain-containing protein [Anaerolineae bacterium]|nr:lamin tail domain-containing protein [Anaerolineae bacterium]HOQ97532.1 lamin tail domain-containing protein [Anaerolineae bacterium]HPL27517.1 lamin tail domain-containing protein [Anaerolineae bacterium]
MSSVRGSRPTMMRETPGADLVIDDVQAGGLTESVVITNRGELDQPLTGWALVSLHGEEVFQFPDGTTVPPGGQVRVLSGEQAQPASDRDLVWTQQHVWSNRSDTALLFDHKGHEVNRFTYPRATIRANRRPKLKILDQDREGFYLRDWDETLPQDRD